jgi:hypothetical protein
MKKNLIKKNEICHLSSNFKPHLYKNKRKKHLISRKKEIKKIKIKRGNKREEKKTSNAARICKRAWKG